MTAEQIKPNPCRNCGGQPTVTHTARRWWEIACRSDGHTVAISSFPREQAVAAWNAFNPAPAAAKVRD